MLAGMDVEATTVMVYGDAAEEILACAAANSCDLIGHVHPRPVGPEAWPGAA